ncbi:MAG: hypothetical protein ABFD13_06460, partial [Candidatus Cryosericum sp.]
LVGHDLIRGPGGVMVYPTTEDTITLRLSAGLSTLWTTGSSVKLLPRLVTIHITITKENLDEDGSRRDQTVSSIHACQLVTTGL